MRRPHDGSMLLIGEACGEVVQSSVETHVVLDEIELICRGASQAVQLPATDGRLAIGAVASPWNRRLAVGDRRRVECARRGMLSRPWRPAEEGADQLQTAPVALLLSPPKPAPGSK